MTGNKKVVPAPRSRRPAAGPGAPALTPKEVFGILRRHIFLVVFLTISGLIIAGVAWFLLLQFLPEYTALGLIRVLPPIETDPMTIGGGALVQRDIQYGHRVYMASLIKQQRTLEELIDRDEIRDTKWFRRFAKFDPNDNITNVHECVLKAFKDLQKHFVAYAHRDAEFVVLKMSWRDAEEAAKIVNQMTDLFLASQGGSRRAEVSAKLTELENRQESVQRDLNAAEIALADVRTRFAVTDLEERPGYFRHTITLKLDALELQQNELILEIRQVQTDMQIAERLATGPVTEQIEQIIEADPVLVLLAQQIALLEADLSGQLARFGENHRVVRQTRERIDEIKARRKIRKGEIAEQTRQANFQYAQDQVVESESRLEELQTLQRQVTVQKQDLDNARVQYEQRVATRDSRREMLNDINKQIESWRIIYADPETPKVQRVGEAPKPLEVSAPRWEFYFPGGTILGLIAGIGLAFALELLNDKVRTPRDVARYLHIPLLGVIPDATEDAQLRDVDLCHVVRQVPYSIISESYRKLRTNLEFSDFGQCKVLLVSSGAAGDGKTSVAVNLATTFAAENKKVLLIDANFRRPSLNTIFAQAKTPSQPVEQSGSGLSTLLTGQCSYQDVKRTNATRGLDIIYAGPLPSTPAELLGGFQMEELINKQRKSYDYVIIDGPPILLVTDAKVLARLVDGTILVFNAAATRRGAAQRTIRELRQVNATILGCVLFAVKAMKGGYFQEQFRSYQQYQSLPLAHPV